MGGLSEAQVTAFVAGAVGMFLLVLAADVATGWRRRRGRAARLARIRDGEAFLTAEAHGRTVEGRVALVEEVYALARELDIQASVGTVPTPGAPPELRPGDPGFREAVDDLR